MKHLRTYLLLAFAVLFAGVLVLQAQQNASRRVSSRSSAARTTTARTTTVQTTTAQAASGNKRPVDVKANRAFRSPKITDPKAVVLVGDVVFHHNGAAISCDSAVRYSDRRIDCFKNVIINQGTGYVYGDRAEYNGDAGTARVYSPVVKVVDGDATLYTYNFTFNTRTKVGNWFGGGVMYQKDNVMESERGHYYSDRKELVAYEKVEMKNLSHKITSDSVRYNTNTRVATFYKRTYIWTQDGEIISAERGRYDTRDSIYFFHDRAYILTPNRETWADTIEFHARREDAFLYGNIQIDDNDNKSSAFGDYGRYWGERGETILTRLPVVANYNDDQSGDTLYMRSDTIFLYVRYPSDDPSFKLFSDEEQAELDSLAGIEGGSIAQLPVDSVALRADSLAAARVKFQRDSVRRADSLLVVDSIRVANPKEFKKMQKAEKARIKADKKWAKTLAKEKKREEKERLRDEKAARQDSIRDAKLAAREAAKRAKLLEKRIKKGRYNKAIDVTRFDSLSLTDSFPHLDSLVRVLDSLARHHIDSARLAEEEKARGDTIFRILRGWHNVRIWGQGTQAVCDSVVGFSSDSTMHMYIDPILWYGESQVVADSITLFAVGGTVHRSEFLGDPIMSSEITPEQYNQSKGRTMTAFFRDNAVYRHDIYGNAEALYYMQEEGDPRPMAFLVATSSAMTFLIEAQLVRYIIARENVEWPVYPMDQIPNTQPTQLRGFRWYGERRPSRADVFDRTFRPTERAEYEARELPVFPIADRILKRRNYLISNRMWGDRNDPLPAHAVEFVRSLK